MVGGLLKTQDSFCRYMRLSSIAVTMQMGLYSATGCLFWPFLMLEGESLVDLKSSSES